MDTLFRFLRRQWSARAELDRIVPAARVLVGVPREAVSAPAVLLVAGERTFRFATADGRRVWQVGWEFQLWTADVPSADRLAARIDAVFARGEARLEDGLLLDIHHLGRRQPRDTGHLRQTSLDYAALLEQPPVALGD